MERPIPKPVRLDAVLLGHFIEGSFFPPPAYTVDEIEFLEKEARRVESETKVNPDVDRDPWKHRSRDMLCQTCMYFVLKIPIGPLRHDHVEVGRCRRHSPTMSGYPVVFKTDWCGDHKLDEVKI